MDARVNFSQPVPDVEPHERRPLVRQATGAPGENAEPPFLQVRRRRAGGVVVRGGPHGRDPPALDGDPPKDFGHPRGLAEDPVRPGCYSNFGKGACAITASGARRRRRRWTTT